jgi:hypothetical protein
VTDGIGDGHRRGELMVAEGILCTTGDGSSSMSDLRRVALARWSLPGEHQVPSPPRHGDSASGCAVPSVLLCYQLSHMLQFWFRFLFFSMTSMFSCGLNFRALQYLWVFMFHLRITSFIWSITSVGVNGLQKDSESYSLAVSL